MEELLILKGVLNDAELLQLGVAQLKPVFFANKAAKEIYTFIHEQYLLDNEVSEDLIIEKFSDKYSKTIEQIIMCSVPNVRNFNLYINKIKENYHNRKKLAIVKKIEENLINNAPVDALIDELLSFNDAEEDKDVSLADIVKHMEEQIQNQKQHTNSIGITSLDNKIITSPGDLIVIGARPSMGKTGLTISIILNKIKRKRGVIFFSLEMPKERIALRMLSNIGEIPMNELTRGLLSDFNKYDKAKKEFIQYEDYLKIIDDASLEEIEMIVKEKKKVMPYLEDIFIDHLGFIQTNKPFKSEHLKMGHITKKLKKIAKSNNVRVWLLSQLNRSLESRPNKRPILADLRESGSIEEDADIVLGLYRQSYYDVKEKGGIEPQPNEMEVIILKQRDGETGIVKTWFNGSIMKVDDNLSTVQEVTMDNKDEIIISDIPDI